MFYPSKAPGDVLYIIQGEIRSLQGSVQKTNKNIWTTTQPGKESTCQTKQTRKQGSPQVNKQKKKKKEKKKKKQLNKQTGKRFSTQAIELNGRQIVQI